MLSDLHNDDIQTFTNDDSGHFLEHIAAGYAVANV